ncbi:hypothetical protein F4703DRAFT_1100550 [Phycomyces blakesleeanus]
MDTMDWTSEAHRAPIKRNNKEKNKEWKDRFRQQWVDRVKSSRQERDNKRRGDTWMQIIVKEEWESFKKENEEAMRFEGVHITDQDIEEEIMSDESMKERYDTSYEDFLQEEQNTIAAAIAMYEEAQSQESFAQYNMCQPRMQCFNCAQFTLQPSIRTNQSRGVMCTYCNFNATEQARYDIRNKPISLTKKNPIGCAHDSKEPSRACHCLFWSYRIHA